MKPITIPPRYQIVGIAAALVVVALFILVGCGNKFAQQFNDAPRTAQVNRSAATVITMPDGFNNLATKCDHGNRLYISYHGDGPYGFGFAVAHDPTCVGVP